MNINDWLNTDNKLSEDIWNRKYRYNNEAFDQWLDRVSQNNKDFKEIIKKRQFLPGGRTLSNIGVDDNSSLFNCYSSGYVPDDYAGIMDTAKNIGLTYKSQGGQGLSLSKLRPINTPIGNRYVSDGIVPFMKIFNEVTEATSQAGSRKGALMMSLDVWHKEALNFITIKSKDGLIEKANLSLEIDDEFMKCIEEFYENGIIKTIKRKENYSGHEIEWEVTPIEVYNKLVENSWDYGDPACLFVNKFRNYNIMEKDNEYNIVTSNPCGEQPLPPNGACCLGSINLSEFVINPYTDNAYFDFEEFKKVVRLGINYMDNLIEINYNRHPLKEQREVSYNYRNIGLGVMGYANMLMKLNMVYGEDDSLKFTDDLFNCMFRTSVETSSELAKEKGSFPKYSEVVWESEIMKNHFTEEEINQLRQNGLRNCSLLSVAPTGTLSSLLGVSGGCEPEFALSFTRRTVGLTNNKDTFYKVYCKSVKEYMDLNNLKDDSKLPKWFISSENIPYINRIKTQGIMQKHIDTAISSTINLPENTTKEQIADIYLQAWKHGLKGITIFRTNCKRTAILSTTDSNKEEKENKDNKLKRGQLVRNDNIIGLKRTLITGCGTLHCSAFFDKNNGEFVELFLGKGSQGGCLSTLNGLARLTSLSARAGVKLVDIVGQLKSANACPSYAIRSATKKDTSKGSCCPSAIANALIDMQKEMKNLIKVTNISEVNKESIQENNENKCPVCGSEIHHSGGCVECKNCGWAKCG